jgi:long-chain fatty acid transport protein
MGRFTGMRTLTGIVRLALALIVATATGSWAGALQGYEIGAPDQMFAAAGREAIARDASTAYTNPAGMTRLQKSELLVGIQPLYGQVDFDTNSATTNTGGDGGNPVGFVPTLGSYFVYSVTDRIKAGFSLNPYAGGGFDYDSDWAGRYFAQESSIMCLGATLSGAYRVNDWLSLGAGFTTVYADAKISAAIPNIDPQGDARATVKQDDFGFGGNAGLLFEPSKTTRVGLMYRSKVEIDLDDALSLENVGPLLQTILQNNGLVGSNVNIGFSLPQTLHAGLYHDISDRYSVMIGLGWEDWSEFSDWGLTLESDTDTSITADYEVKDTWHASIGMEYRPADRWRTGVGIAFDSGAINDKDRVPVLPLDRQWRFGTGFEHDLTEAWTLGAQYTLVDMGQAPIDQTKQLTGTLKGDYSPNILHALNLSIQKKF